MPGLVVAWVDDEPQPGLVRVEFIDAHGATATLTDKVAVFDGTGRLGPLSAYPHPILIDCEVVGPVRAVRGRPMVTVRLRWSVEADDGRTEFDVDCDRLVVDG